MDLQYSPEQLQLRDSVERFVRDEWPAMVERIRRLGLDLNVLLRAAQPGSAA